MELCFQAAGLWQAGREGQLALPQAVDRVAVLVPDADGELYAVAAPAGESVFDAVVVDAEGRVVVRLEGYHSIPVPMPIPDDVAGPLAEAYADIDG